MRHLARLLLATIAFAPCAAATAASHPVTVRDAWSRPASASAVVYATIGNRGPRDELVAASSPIAAKIAFHESTQSATSMGSIDGMPMGGMIAMEPLSRITIPAHARRLLAPGGYHLMLTGLRRELRIGDRFALRLRFRNAGIVDAIVIVRAT